MTTPHDEPAFPNHAEWPNKHEEPWYLIYKNGLTKLEYFSAMAMQGLLGNSEMIDKINFDQKTIAVNSISYATALLDELEKRKAGK